MPRARTKARKRALDILFESEARGDDPRQVLLERRVTDDAPPVAITEAVELARTLSTDDSPRFLNGVLSRIADLADHLRATR